MAKIVNLGLRGLQFLWTLLILCLVGNMIHDFHNHNPSVVNYAMFVAVFGMLSLLYLIAATFNEAFAINSLFVVIADALNTIFFLIGGIALAARLGVHSCGNRDYRLTNSVVSGSSKRCHEAQAVTAFLWFGFITFAVSLVFSALATRRGANLGGSSKGAPAMSQA